MFQLQPILELSATLGSQRLNTTRIFAKKLGDYITLLQCTSVRTGNLILPITSDASTTMDAHQISADVRPSVVECSPRLPTIPD